jgi:hypothetical protein
MTARVPLLLLAPIEGPLRLGSYAALAPPRAGGETDAGDVSA